MESHGSLDSIAFDKTGTLTEGEPKVTDVRTAEGVNETELLRIVNAVETLSKHSLARAIARDGKKKLGEDGSGSRAEITPATDLKSITGRGIQALAEATSFTLAKWICLRKSKGRHCLMRSERSLNHSSKTVVRQ